MNKTTNLHPVGHVRSPATKQTDEGWGQVTSRIEVLPPYRHSHESEPITMMLSGELFFEVQGVMLGWTCLLAWGSWKLVERRAVLLLTVVPVLAGLLALLFWRFSQDSP